MDGLDGACTPASVQTKRARHDSAKTTLVVVCSMDGVETDRRRGSRRCTQSRCQRVHVHHQNLRGQITGDEGEPASELEKPDVRPPSVTMRTLFKPGSPKPHVIASTYTERPRVARAAESTTAGHLAVPGRTCGTSPHLKPICADQSGSGAA